MSGWRVVADLDLCQGHQMCQSEAPQVFGFDRAADHVVLLQEHPDDDLRDAARRAVVFCPSVALSIVEHPAEED